MLVFQNNDLIPLEAFTTFGVNAKPNSENPIGFFGTGLKYAVAVTLRLGGMFSLWRGDEEYVFYTKETEFRNKEFTAIRMKKRRMITSPWSYHKLPFTTELGKKWLPWMAVRELESNTRDEGGTSWAMDDSDTSDVRVEKGVTSILISCPEMEDAYANINQIFVDPNLKLLFEDDQIQMFDAPSDYIFYRGLRVTDLNPRSMFTYNFKKGIDLTEDRTSKYSYWDQGQVMRFLAKQNDTPLFKKIMDAKEGESYEANMPWDNLGILPSSTFMSALGSRYHLGGKLPPRMKTYYDAMNPKEEEDPSTEIRLFDRYWNHIMVVLRDKEDDLSQEIAGAIQENF